MSQPEHEREAYPPPACGQMFEREVPGHLPWIDAYVQLADGTLGRVGHYEFHSATQLDEGGRFCVPVVVDGGVHMELVCDLTVLAVDKAELRKLETQYRKQRTGRKAGRLTKETTGAVRKAAS